MRELRREAIAKGFIKPRVKLSADELDARGYHYAAYSKRYGGARGFWGGAK